MMFLFIIGILSGNNKGKSGALLFILLTPALFYDFSNQVNFKNIRFNILGSINVGLAIWYFFKQRLTERGIYDIVILLCLPLVSILSFTLFRTPDFSDIDFKLGANFDTTGGFGSNQVSTVFGLGLFLIFFLWSHGITLTGKKLLDISTLFLFLFQGLLSFSRGGMIGSVLAILVLLYFFAKIPNNSAIYLRLKKSRKYIIPGIMVMILSAGIANNLTKGQLLLRYMGENTATLTGVSERNLNTLTTGRFDIALQDLDLFNDHFLTGVGAGASMYLRRNSIGIVSHVEFTRLLAEHGILGLVCILILFFIALKVRFMTNDAAFKGFLFACFLIAIYTTFHSAMRTYLAPILIGLSTVIIKNEKNPLHRE